jgi:hypothetical protein
MFVILLSVISSTLSQFVQQYPVQPALAYAPSRYAVDGSSLSRENVDQNGAVDTGHSALLSACAAFICVEYKVDSAVGTSGANTDTTTKSVSRLNEAYANQGGGASNNQFQQASYNYQQNSATQDVDGLLPSNGGPFPFYQSVGRQSLNAYAYGINEGSQATTQHTNYSNENSNATYVLIY